VRSEHSSRALRLQQRAELLFGLAMLATVAPATRRQDVVDLIRTTAIERDPVVRLDALCRPAKRAVTSVMAEQLFPLGEGEVRASCNSTALVARDTHVSACALQVP
jgi:hypothetical protein